MLKRFLLYATLAVLGLAPAAAFADKAQTFLGNTGGGPLWNRVIGAGPSIRNDDQVRYRAQKFRLLEASQCTVHSTQEYDGYLHLYRNSFNPNSQLTNLIDGDDDGELGIGTSQIPSDLNDNDGVALTAGTHVVVTSGFSNGAFGAFQNTVQCNGNAQPLHGSCGIQFAAPSTREEEVCLQDRFLVVITNISNSVTGRAVPVRTGSSDTGLFWFFSDPNWEVMVKVINGCALNGHYWVFAGALTNQRYTISVADNTTLAVKGYSNPLGVRSQAFADTSAFPCN